MPDDHELSPSDAELAKAIKELKSDAPVDELYRRHRSAVLAYARTCCRDPHTAEDLASEAFARTLHAVRSGGGPQAAWRPYLLTVVRRTAADWAGTARRTELSPDFEQWLANLPGTPEVESGEERVLRLEEGSLVLTAFRSLPERWQSVLWHTAVEKECAARVGALLGIGASGVSSLASRAREGLREAYLAAHVAHASKADECRRYSSLLGAAVRRAGGRPNKDLERHLADCARCRHARTELTDLNDRLGSFLPTGVLLWGGSAYVAARMTETAASAGGAALAPGPPDGGTAWWAHVKDAPYRTGAVAGGVVAAIGLAILILPITPFSRDDGKASPPERAASHPPLELNPPPVTPTPSPPDSPSRGAEPSTTAPDTASKEPATRSSPPEVDLGPVKWSGSFRNAGLSDKCVEPAGTAVVQNTCDGSQDQVWQTVTFKENKDKDYTWLRNAATRECIDYSVGTKQFDGSSYTMPVEMRPCRAGGRGQLFWFQPWPWNEPEGGHRIAAEVGDGSPWDAMQLGMQDWGEGTVPSPETNAPLLMTYNYEHNTSPRLRYLLGAREGQADRDRSQCTNSTPYHSTSSSIGRCLSGGGRELSGSGPVTGGAAIVSAQSAAVQRLRLRTELRKARTSAGLTQRQVAAPLAEVPEMTSTSTLVWACRTTSSQMAEESSRRSQGS